uniref:UDP-N-acetyl-alpha-D-galactosamine:polypeptide N-acetylgalactosaminyltransferase 11 (GalNAc-T11) n=1 Tax=Eptatretus burgeri TaxID=7764 RepID=A0A8C4Q1F5_EPTBU
MGSGNKRWYKCAGAMGVTTHRYFCYGLLCASLAWALLLLLFLQLSDDRLPAATGLHRRLEPMSHHDNSLVSSPARKPAIKWKTHSVEKKKLAGAGHLSSELGMIYSVEDQDVRDFGYQRHAFNLLISNRLGVLRPIPDTRHPRSPTMAGGLFAIRRDYFNQLGQYDQGMDIWGGENLEISFRIWMCGGLLEIIPCSRVGHVFRRRRPYGSPGGHDTTAKNSLRLAHVWLDKYKENFFLLRPELRNTDFGNVSERTALRHRLGCKPFSWYLQNIYPEMDVAGHGPPPALALGKLSRKAKVVQRGRIRHLAIGSCLAALGHPSDKRGRVTLRECSLTDANQVCM